MRVGHEIVRGWPWGGQKSTGQSIAIKLFRKSLFSTPEEEQRFAQEVRTLAEIRHPHIVSIIDRGRTENGTPFLVTRFVNGWPIDKYVDHRLRTGGQSVPDSHEFLIGGAEVPGGRPPAV